MADHTLKIDNARYVLTLDGQRRIIRDASILVEDGRTGWIRDVDVQPHDR